MLLAADIILDVAVEVHRAVRTGVVRRQVLRDHLLPINGFAESWAPNFHGHWGGSIEHFIVVCRDLQCSNFRRMFVLSQNSDRMAS